MRTSPLSTTSFLGQCVIAVPPSLRVFVAAQTTPEIEYDILHCFEKQVALMKKLLDTLLPAINKHWFGESIAFSLVENPRGIL